VTRSVASIVAGEPTEGAPGGTLKVQNPSRLEEAVSVATLADADTFVKACRTAKEAQPAWATTPPPVRGRAIQQLGRLVEANAESLARLITQEIGKPIAESRGEVQEVADTCSFLQSEGRRLYGMTVPTDLAEPG
jgi:alpha-ketoglutaric semialdehyde dehydrogenase